MADGFNALGWRFHSELITTAVRGALCPFLFGFMALMKRASLNQVSRQQV